MRDGEVIARGRNLGKTDGDPTAHGEMVAVRRCLADHGRAALVGSTLYTSGEPCAMCMGAIIWCHLGRLVFAASVAQLATKIDQIMVSGAEIAAKAPFAPIRDFRRRAGGRGDRALCQITVPEPAARGHHRATAAREGLSAHALRSRRRVRFHALISEGSPFCPRCLSVSCSAMQASTSCMRKQVAELCGDRNRRAEHHRLSQ